jgi:ABC-type Fe3+-hydroxamate transport system substrate-binding protein
VLQTGPLITVGGKTFINDLIELSGGSSISARETADYPQFSREAVSARKPDVIIAPRVTELKSSVNNHYLRNLRELRQFRIAEFFALTLTSWTGPDHG